MTASSRHGAVTIWVDGVRKTPAVRRSSPDYEGLKYVISFSQKDPTIIQRAACPSFVAP